MPVSEACRDSLYQLLMSVGGACPIPVLNPCIQLIKEIDQTFRRTKIQLTQSSDLVNLACSMLLQVKDQRAQAQEQSKHRKWKRKLPWIKKGNEEETVSEDISPEATKLVKSIEKILDDLIDYARQLQGYSFFDRVQKEEEIKKRLEGFKDRLTKSVETFRLASLVNLEVWLRDFDNARDEDHKTLEGMRNDFRRLENKVESGFNRIERRMGPVDHTKDFEKFDPPQRYVKEVLPRLLPSGVDPSIESLLCHDRLRYDVGLLRLEETRGNAPSRPEIRVAEDNGEQRNRYAVKKYRDPNPEHIPHFLRELRISQLMNHPNIVKFFGVNTTVNLEGEESLNLVCEYCENGNLEQYARQGHPVDFLRVIYEVALALEYLHSGRPGGGTPIIHGDIRPNQILIHRDGHAKLTSFRRSRQLIGPQKTAEIEHSTQNNNERWRAPETMEGFNPDEEVTRGDYQTSSDIYGWAATAGTLFCTDWSVPKNQWKLCFPFAKHRHMTVLMMRMSAGEDIKPYDPELLQTKTGNQQLAELLTQCLARAAERPTASEVVARLGVIGGYNNNLTDKLGLEDIGLVTPPATPPQELEGTQLEALPATAFP